MEKRALGRGLSALIPQKISSSDTVQETVISIPLASITTNKYQPRVEFNQDRLNDLVNSIREKGVIQPVLVRKKDEGYELIAGERRLRAVRSLGIESIPAIIKNVQDIDMLEISLIENIQREGLNPIEEANAYQKFISDFSFTQEKIAQVLGKDRSTVANMMRLLGLPQKVQDFISKGMMTAGHAKAVLSLPNEIEQMRVSNLVVKKGLSVRETEALVARRGAGTYKKPEKTSDQNLGDIATRLQQLLGTRVRISHGKKRGKIEIEYYSNEDLNRVLDIMFAKKA